MGNDPPPSLPRGPTLKSGLRGRGLRKQEESWSPRATGSLLLGLRRDESRTVFVTILPRSIQQGSGPSWTPSRMPLLGQHPPVTAGLRGGGSHGRWELSGS